MKKRASRFTPLNPVTGFTLLEMLTSIAIIGMLVAILFPTIMRVQHNAKIAAARRDVQRISTALTNYMADFGDFPPESFRNAALVNMGLGADPASHSEASGSTELSEVFLWCLSTTSKHGPYLEIPLKNRVNIDNDYYSTNYTNSVWWSGSSVPLYEFLDPWGNPYRYHRTQPEGSPTGASTASEGKGFLFWIVSNGVDGKPGFAQGSETLPSGDDDGDTVVDERDGSEDGARAAGKYSDDVVNWR